MGEAIIGFFVMVCFVIFIMFKNRNIKKGEETIQDIDRQYWWAEREQEREDGPVIVSSNSKDND